MAIAFMLSIFSVNLYADGIKKYDLNDDVNCDRIEHYRENRLIRLEEDRNIDGRVDVVTEYVDDKNTYKIIKQDTTHDGRFNRKEVYERLEKGKIKIVTYVDNDRDGNYEIQYSEILDSDQK
jgi:hypothetical protein